MFYMDGYMSFRIIYLIVKILHHVLEPKRTPHSGWSGQSRQGGTLLLVCQSNGVHFPVRQPLLGESLFLQLPTITDK